MPDSISSLGVSIAPADRITSRRACTVAYRSDSRYSTPVARLWASKSTCLTQQPVRTTRLRRRPMIGCRYAVRGRHAGVVLVGVDLEEAGPSVTVAPSLKRTVGRPDRGGGVQHRDAARVVRRDCRSVTGPSRPWWSPGPSLFSNRAISGQHSSALQPVQPIAAHSSRSSRRGPERDAGIVRRAAPEHLGAGVPQEAVAAGPAARSGSPSRSRSRAAAATRSSARIFGSSTSDGPASSRHTVTDGSSDSRAASTHPAEPPPTTT